ncbi:hypothetical protein RND59_04550 [Vibrio ruber]|uniref:hypothetical protein n=1 Tax=Vibrio ruber TaxID=184755 RepID=UPI002892C7A4|nr:hypothetical protein [Vibrio ruber]WNJ96373.1 hypothetical protein RND59_04550 [Vibrio ruber]
MIDSITEERIMILIDEKYGPYIRVSAWYDATELEDVLLDNYNIYSYSISPNDLEVYGGKEFYFGSTADPEVLQRILDKIEFSRTNK